MPPPDRVQRGDGDRRTAISDGMAALMKDYCGVEPATSSG
jgi:hypothetical protein